MLSFCRFTAFLTLVLLLAFSIHMFFASTKELFLGYCFNYLVTIASFLWLSLIIRKKGEKLGFIFMFISGIKFFFFFLIYKPLSITVTETKVLFISFFVPYTICSIYEVYTLAKIMNKKNRETNQKNTTIKIKN